MPCLDSIDLSPGSTGPARPELAELVLAADDLSDLLQRLATAAVHHVDGAASAVITVTRDGRPTTRSGLEQAAGARRSGRLSVPLSDLDRATGSVTLYPRLLAGFGPVERGQAQRFADESSRVLSLALRLARGNEVTDQLSAELASRTVIDHALGIVMGQNRCDANVAFAILRAASQNRHVRLRVVAAEIASTVSRRPPAAGRGVRLDARLGSSGS
ncbi:ANTAR domain-containing protein [Pengzhenrongella frigida]|uniref:ANTAR domain-containing protein n=1 Tax=Pengzhenrongella frigida TaxID=1259133 RepID=UPI0013E9D0DE|nr:ANTAR domain-containing protein [Cellulomonas sp. HLT2-17]